MLGTRDVTLRTARRAFGLAGIAATLSGAAWSAQGQEPSEAPAATEAATTPRLSIHVYADASAQSKDGLGEPATFSLGQTDLFMTSRLSERFSGLAEVVFEAGKDNAIGVDVERLLLSYRAGDSLSVGFGRYHTAIGYYNTAYHHGTWFQTATGRPRLFAFEDDEGPLPIHNVGVTVSGEFPATRGNLHYLAEIGNGRSWVDGADPVQNVVDEDSHKAVNLGLVAKPTILAGLQIGVSAYDDRLNAGPRGRSKVNERIWAAHAVYQTFETEVLAEVVEIRHAFVGSRNTLSTKGAYAQVSHAIGPWKPYARFQYLDVPNGDPVLLPGRRQGPSAGLRYDFVEHVALKAQYDRLRVRGTGTLSQGTLQAAFAF